MSRLYNSSNFSRSEADFYPTPPDLARALPDGMAVFGIELPGPILEPCCGDGALARTIGRETGLPVVGTDLYPFRYPDGHPFYVSLEPVDARDLQALRRVAVDVGARSIVTNPPYGRDHAKIAEALLELVQEGAIQVAALLVPHQFDAAGSRRHLFTDLHCALRIVMPWRPVWIEGTQGGGTISSVWWVWTAVPRNQGSPGTVYVERRL